MGKIRTPHVCLFKPMKMLQFSQIERRFLLYPIDVMMNAQIIASISVLELI